MSSLEMQVQAGRSRTDGGVKAARLEVHRQKCEAFQGEG